MRGNARLAQRAAACSGAHLSRPPRWSWSGGRWPPCRPRPRPRRRRGPANEKGSVRGVLRLGKAAEAGCARRPGLSTHVVQIGRGPGRHRVCRSWRSGAAVPPELQAILLGCYRDLRAETGPAGVLGYSCRLRAARWSQASTGCCCCQPTGFAGTAGSSIAIGDAAMHAAAINWRLTIIDNISIIDYL